MFTDPVLLCVLQVETTEKLLSSEQAAGQELRVNVAALQALLTSTQWSMDNREKELSEAKEALVNQLGDSGSIAGGMNNVVPGSEALVQKLRKKVRGSCLVDPP